MIQLLGDLFVATVILAVLWTFVPPAWRHSAGLAARAIGRQLLQRLAELAEVAERLTYHAVVGRPLAMDAPAPAAKTLDTAEPPAIAELDNNPPDSQTDRQTAGRALDARAGRVLRLDRSRSGAVRALLLAGWSKSQIRSVIKGDNNALGPEIDRLAAELEEPAPTEYITDLEKRINQEASHA